MTPRGWGLWVKNLIYAKVVMSHIVVKPMINRLQYKELFLSWVQLRVGSGDTSGLQSIVTQLVLDHFTETFKLSKIF
jgi:hypothetical protein